MWRLWAEGRERFEPWHKWELEQFLLEGEETQGVTELQSKKQSDFKVSFSHANMHASMLNIHPHEKKVRCHLCWILQVKIENSKVDLWVWHLKKKNPGSNLRVTSCTSNQHLRAAQCTHPSWPSAECCMFWRCCCCHPLIEPRCRELPLLKPDRDDRSVLFREYSVDKHAHKKKKRRWRCTSQMFHLV